MDTVARTKSPIVVTKNKRPIIKVIPYSAEVDDQHILEGSVLEERGNPFSTGENWDADIT